MGKQRFRNQSCWRVMEIANPRNSAEVDAEAARHCKVLKDATGKTWHRTGDLELREGTYWGRFTSGTPS